MDNPAYQKRYHFDVLDLDCEISLLPDELGVEISIEHDYMLADNAYMIKKDKWGWEGGLIADEKDIKYSDSILKYLNENGTPFDDVILQARKELILNE